MKSIVLESPDGKFFRRIDPDGSFYKKYLGMPWERHDPDHISEIKLPKYLEIMTKKLKWKKTIY